MVFGFIKRSNGYIEVSSSPGAGASFHLYLPQTKGKVLPDIVDEVPQESLPQGHETILAVDDEEGLLELAQDSLEMLGYRVFTAADGQSALDILTSGESIDLLFSDVVMPGGIDGYDLAELATAHYPDLKILLTSGYTGKSTGERPSTPDLPLLKKPYSHFQLAHQIRGLLGESIEAPPTTEPTIPPMLTWSEAMSLGIDTMDQDHKTVFELLNRCREALLANLENEANASIDDLISFSRTHFSREEAIMTACKYSGQANHQQVHQLLLNQAKKIRVSYQRGGSGTTGMIESLGSWWVDHIKAMDQAYSKEFQHQHELIELTLSQMEHHNP
jgi:hemerythrin-like metal-binding protein